MTNLKNCKNIDDFCKCFDISKTNLDFILYGKDESGLGTDRFYKSFEIPKKNGQNRSISAPNGPLLALQKKILEILEEIDSCDTSLNVSYAFKKGIGILNNSSIHRNKKIIAQIDLKDFFDSFSFYRLRGFFQKDSRFKLSDNLSGILANLLCYQGKLPQGAPTSPIITNLIAKILDKRILKLTSKYKLEYSRYADDLNFSTNDWNFKENYSSFLEEIGELIQKSGFEINKEKTRIKFFYQRQTVTGLVVNKKINIPKSYYKKTRAMAHSLYKKGVFEVNKRLGTIEQLLGRFSFIDQIDYYNNKKWKEMSTQPINIREREYRRFLTYINFLNDEKPLICTEGKTDITYLKAALKSEFINYPELVANNTNGTFDFKLNFLKRSKKISFFYKTAEGADSLAQFLVEIREDLKYFQKKYGRELTKPFFLMFDNELETPKKPIRKFINFFNLKKCMSTIKEKNIVQIDDTFPIFLITTPLVNDLKDCEIEHLFENSVIEKTIGGKKFLLSPNCKDDCYGKAVFASHVMKNYKKINFTNFKPIFDNIVKKIEETRSKKIEQQTEEML